MSESALRKALALKLIKLAHFIYPPQVTKEPGIGMLLIDPDAARADREYERRASGTAHRFLATTCIDALTEAARRESRGYDS